jgi:hypothetical protein
MEMQKKTPERLHLKTTQAKKKEIEASADLPFLLFLP